MLILLFGGMINFIRNRINFREKFVKGFVVVIFKRFFCLGMMFLIFVIVLKEFIC